MKRQTQRERHQIKSELAAKFKVWITLSDIELITTVKARWPAVEATPPLSQTDRGLLLRFLTMNELDKID